MKIAIGAAILGLVLGCGGGADPVTTVESQVPGDLSGMWVWDVGTFDCLGLDGFVRGPDGPEMFPDEETTPNRFQSDFTDAGGNTVSVDARLDPATGEVTGSVVVRAPTSETAGATGPMCKAYVTEAGSDTVAVFDLGFNPNPNEQLIARIPVGVAPRGMLYHFNLDIMLVANSGSDSVSVIDLRTDTVVQTITGDFDRPQEIIRGGGPSNALVSNEAGFVTMIDMETFPYTVTGTIQLTGTGTVGMAILESFTHFAACNEASGTVDIAPLGGDPVANTITTAVANPRTCRSWDGALFVGGSDGLEWLQGDLVSGTGVTSTEFDVGPVFKIRAESSSFEFTSGVAIPGETRAGWTFLNPDPFSNEFGFEGPGLWPSPVANGLGDCFENGPIYAAADTGIARLDRGDGSGNEFIEAGLQQAWDFIGVFREATTPAPRTIVLSLTGFVTVHDQIGRQVDGTFQVTSDSGPFAPQCAGNLGFWVAINDEA